jgi:hypothetical protein
VESFVVNNSIVCFFSNKSSLLKKGIALTPFEKKQKKDKRSIAPAPFTRETKSSKYKMMHLFCFILITYEWEGSDAISINGDITQQHAFAKKQILQNSL